MSVMIGTPVKNASIWLKDWIKMVESLTYKHKRIVLSYGESSDETLQILKEWKKNSNLEIEVYKEPAMLIPSIPVSGALIAPVYRDFQTLISEDYFLLLDCDVVEAPKNLIEALLKHKVDLVAPCVWIKGRPNWFYDTYAFRLNGYRFHPFNPPCKGKKELLQVDSVGTCYLATSKCFLDGEFSNPHPHIQFCNSIRKKGYKIFVDSTLNI